MMRRRAFLGGLAGALAAPAIVRAQSLGAFAYPGGNPGNILPQGPFTLAQRIPGLVGCWPLEGDARALVGPDGALVGGPTMTLGQRGPAMSFDGTPQYVDFGEPPSLNFAGGSCFCGGWALLNSLPPSGYSVSLLANRQTLVTAGNSAQFAISVNDTGQLIAASTSPGPSWHPAASANGLVTAGMPFMFGFWFDGSTNTQQAIFNGASVATAGVGAPLYYYASMGFRAAYAYYPSNNSYLDGLLWGLFAFDRAPSATEITALYAAPYAALRPAPWLSFPTLGGVSGARGVISGFVE